MARGHVVAESHDANKNIMGRAHTNQRVDTRMYQVKFAGGKVTELTANIIAESMYTQCYADRNEYSLLDVILNYCKDNKAISLTDQQTSIQERPVTHRPLQVCKFAASGRTVLPHGRSCLKEITSSADSGVCCCTGD